MCDHDITLSHNWLHDISSDQHARTIKPCIPSGGKKGHSYLWFICSAIKTELVSGPIFEQMTMTQSINGFFHCDINSTHGSLALGLLALRVYILAEKCDNLFSPWI